MKRRGKKIRLQWVVKRLVEKVFGAVFMLTWWYFIAWIPFRFGMILRNIYLKIWLKHCGWGVLTSVGVWIEYPWNIEISSNVWLGQGVRLEGMGGISIGKDTKIAFQCALQTAGHEYVGMELIRKQPIVCNPIKIGSDVWLGARTMVKYNITIHDRAISGMGSIVVKDIPPNEIHGGNPASFLKKRD